MSTRDAGHYELLVQIEEMARRARVGHRQASAAIADARGGYARGGGDGSGGGGSPTEQAALGNDPARLADSARNKDIRDAHRALGHLLGIYTQWTSTTPIATKEPAGCQSCARLEDSRGKPTWSPIARRSTTVHGALAEPRDLCRWCYDRAMTTGQLPTRAELRVHHSGRNLRVPA